MNVKAMREDVFSLGIITDYYDIKQNHLGVYTHTQVSELQFYTKLRREKKISCWYKRMNGLMVGVNVI